MEKRIMVIGLFLLVLAALLLTAGCKAKEPAGAAGTETGAKTSAETAKTVSSGGSGKVGNVPLETAGSFMNIKCGDGICTNREYLSDTKKFTCRSLLDSCSLDVNGKLLGTENYFICKKDCEADCDLDFDLKVCTTEENVYEITLTDSKGNLYNYLILYRAELAPFMKYGDGKGKWTLDLRAVAPAIGEMKSMEIMPRVMNKDGTISDCSNHLKTFTSITKC